VRLRVTGCVGPRSLLSKLLEHEGYEARTAVNGREALAALAQESFDAVLLDIVMPEVDGMRFSAPSTGHASEH